MAELKETPRSAESDARGHSTTGANNPSTNQTAALYGSASRRRPPYARELADRLADRSNWPRYAGTSPDGSAVSIWIAAGGKEAWKWAKAESARRLLLLAPADRDPGDFDWRIIAPHAPTILLPFDNIPSSFLDRLAVSILRDGSSHALLALDRGIVRYDRRAA